MGIWDFIKKKAKLSGTEARIILLATQLSPANCYVRNIAKKINMNYHYLCEKIVFMEEKGYLKCSRDKGKKFIISVSDKAKDNAIKLLSEEEKR